VSDPPHGHCRAASTLLVARPSRSFHPFRSRLAVCGEIIMSNRLGTGALAALLLCLPAPQLLAKTDHTPPGDPCAKGNGNPCSGNEGNSGSQGNSGKGKVTYGQPGPIDIPLPPIGNRAAYINQIGDDHRANIVQGRGLAYARIDQEGSGHDAAIVQSDGGAAYAKVGQTGADNLARVTQSGEGQNILYLAQQGSLNSAKIDQNAQGAVHNGAIVTQMGVGNALELGQSGSDNRAILTQNGDNNAMTAVQNGDANRLIWTQTGSNLSDLSIEQSGGQALQVTQTGIGK
jgi:hypothetical protein